MGKLTRRRLGGIVGSIAVAAALWTVSPVGEADRFATRPAGAATVAGGNGSGTAPNQVGWVGGVAVDAAGVVYVSEGARVAAWAPGAGRGLVAAGTGSYGAGLDQISNAEGLVVTDTGDLYVAESGNDRVTRWSPGAESGVVVAGAGGQGDGADQLFGPTDVAFDSAGNLYVADSVNHRIQKYAPGATSGVTVVGGGPTDPQMWGIAIDAADNLYVAETSAHTVRRYAPGATTGTVVAGGNGWGTGLHQLNTPMDVVVDADGAVLVSERYNARVVRWSSGAASGEIVAGSGAAGPGPTEFDLPGMVALDANGHLYVADVGNHRVQRWDRVRRGISIGGASAGEGGAGSATTVTLNLAMPDAAVEPLCVWYATADGSATGVVAPGSGDGAQDYLIRGTPKARALLLAAGRTSGQIALKVLGDDAVEGDETFTVSIGPVTRTTAGRCTDPTAAAADVLVSRGSAEVVILDDDAGVIFRP